MKSKLNFLVLVFCSAMLFLSCTKDEVVMTAEIRGFVTDYTNSNTPIAGASVSISSLGITKTTGSDGSYEFKDIEPGAYTVQVMANGYQTTTKQTTVYAGQSSTLDFQLSPSAANVEVAPQMLSFGPQNDQLSFVITNKGNSSLQYSISEYPNYLTVSPSSGSVAAKGKQTVTVSVNRNMITEDVTTQLLVNIGNDSYPVNISVNSQEVSQKVSVTPSVLDFGTSYTELQFSVKNIGTAGDLVWNISSPSETCLSVTPMSATTTMGNSTQVTVKLDRSKLLADDLQTFLTINVPGGSVSVQVLAKKQAEEGGGETPDREIAVKANLLAYYTFDDETLKDSFEYGLDGQLYNDPTFITDTPNGKGKAVFFNATKEQFAVIPYCPFAGRNMLSLNFWLKDFGNGPIITSIKEDEVDGGTILANENGTFTYYNGNMGIYSRVDFLYKYSVLQDNNWHMVTFVQNQAIVDIYIDGVKVDTATNSDLRGITGDKIMLGGSTEDYYRGVSYKSSLKMDNLRIYGAALTSAQVKEIYNSEK